MKTFNDLKFNLHPNPGFDTQAVMFFDNGYGISVITGENAYSDDENPYECAVIKGNNEIWKMVYDTPITNDVIGFCNKNKVTEIMKQIQELWYDDKISIVLDNDLPYMEKFNSKEECNNRYLDILDCITYYPES